MARGSDDEEDSSLSGSKTRSKTPERLEDSLYLSERADNLGQAARAYRNATLEKLLEDRETLLVVRRRSAVLLLEEFIRVEPEDADEMPDALLRLAELRWETARAEYLEAFAAWQKVPVSNRGPEPVPAYASAVELYDRILTKHRDFERYDLVLYMKAFALVEAGDLDGALVLYGRIRDEFPESRFVPDAHMAFAEAAFGGSYDYQSALRDYEKVLTFPSSGLYDLALFKSAWCLWKLGRTDEAATRFRRVLDLGDDRSKLTAEQRRRLEELQTEALDYLIQVFTEDERNTAADVFGFLEGIGGEKYAYRVLSRLSETYVGQARYDRAVQAYRLLLEMDPASPEAPTYQREIAACYAGLEDDPNTVKALGELAARYKGSADWGRAQSDPEVVAGAEKLGEKAVRVQALRWHEVGQKDKQTIKLERAVELYAVYLEHYGTNRRAYEIEFYRAEILFHRLSRNKEAGDGYLAAARRNPKGEFTRDALYNAIGAFERIREVELKACGSAPGGKGSGGNGAAPKATCAETENDQKFSQAIELYVQLFPNDPDLPEILFRQGKLYYDRGVYDPAVRLWGQLLERFPKSEYAGPAGDLILDSFNRAEDFGNIEKWARRLKKSAAFASADAQRRLDGLILASVFKFGEQLAQKDDHGGAAEAYFRAAEEFPNDPRAKKAYYNAGLERQRAGDLGGAADAFDRLIERFPGSEEGALAAWAGAQMYESIAQFSDAARYYEAYAEKFPKAPKATDAAYNAVLLRVTAGEHAAGIRNGRRFVSAHGTSALADDVTFFIGRAHEGAEEWNEAARVYRQFIGRTKSADRKVEAATRLGKVLRRAGDRSGAEKAFGEAGKMGKGRAGGKLKEGRYAAAEARYLEGELVLADYEAVRIAGEMEGLRGRLQKKSELLKKAAVIFSDVVTYRVAEWVTAALFQIGHSYELFASSLREAPVPEGLSEEEQQVYQDQLSAFIIPMEERALEAFEGGYQKALELRIYNSWTEKLRDGLTRLNDVQYPPFRELAGGITGGDAIKAPVPLDALAKDRVVEASTKAPKSKGGGS